MKRFCSIFCIVALVLTMCVPVMASDAGNAGLREPAGLLAAKDGTLYVTDRLKHQVFSLNASGAALVAGFDLTDGQSHPLAGGHYDTNAKDALFTAPTDMIEWMDGIVISDTGNNCLRLLKDGSVRTLAGTGNEGLLNGIASYARFSKPMGLATDRSENLYIADSGNGVIRKLAKNGSVSTYASGFEMPAGLCWMDDALYVADAGSNQIFRIKNGNKELVAGNAVKQGEEWSCGFADGPVAKAAFSQPMALLATNGAIYIADTGNSAVRVLENGRVSTISSSADNPLYPIEPVGLAMIENTLYVADRFAGVVYTIDVAKGEYNDVAADDEAYDAIRTLSRIGLVGGVGGGLFAPENTITRAQLATLMMRYIQRLDGDTILTGNASYSDVPANTWYTAAASWANDAGLVTGYLDGRFGAEDALSYQQCVTVLYRCAQLLGVDTEIKCNALGLDSVNISSYALDAMLWASEKGIITNPSFGPILPTDSLTRAQFCTIFANWISVVE